MKFNFFNRKPKDIKKEIEAPEELNKIEADNAKPHQDHILDSEGINKLFAKNERAGKQSMLDKFSENREKESTENQEDK